MQNLIRDLLYFSRVDSEASPPMPIDLREVFDEVARMLSGNAKENEVQVTRSELPVVTGDRTQLTQLMMNLINNGIKYRSQQPPRIHVWAERNGAEWLISIRDNGIGIEPRHQEQIFEIFKRLHSPQAYPGTGIGLAVCRRIVHRHGGRIWVDSEPGKGSVFHFTIPMEAERYER